MERWNEIDEFVIPSFEIYLARMSIEKKLEEILDRIREGKEKLTTVSFEELLDL